MQQIEMPKKSEESNAKEDFLSSLLSQKTLEGIKTSSEPKEEEVFLSNKTLEEFILLSKVIQDTTKTLLEWEKNLEESHILEKECISALREEAAKKLHTLLDQNSAKIREIRREVNKKHLNGTESYDSKMEFIGYSEKGAYPEKVSTQGNSKPKLKLITSKPATDSSNTKESHEDTLFSNLETKGFEITIKDSQFKTSFWEVRKNNLFFTLQDRKYIDFPTLKIITQDLGFKKVIERKKIEQDVVEKLIDAVDKLANTKEILSTEEITIILFYFGVTEPTEKMLDQRYLPFGIIDESFYSPRVKIKRNNKIKNELNDKFLDGLTSKGYEIIRSNGRFDTIGKSRLIFYFGPKKSTEFNRIKIKGLHLLNQREIRDFALFPLGKTNLLLDAVDKLANTEECLNQEEIKIILLYLGVENPTEELLSQKDLPFYYKKSFEELSEKKAKRENLKDKDMIEIKRNEKKEWTKNLHNNLTEKGFEKTNQNNSTFTFQKGNLFLTINHNLSKKTDYDTIRIKGLIHKQKHSNLKKILNPVSLSSQKIEQLIYAVDKLANTEQELNETEIRVILNYFEVNDPDPTLLNPKNLPFRHKQKESPQSQCEDLAN